MVSVPSISSSVLSPPPGWGCVCAAFPIPRSAQSPTFPPMASAWVWRSRPFVGSPKRLGPYLKKQQEHHREGCKSPPPLLAHPSSFSLSSPAPRPLRKKKNERKAQHWCMVLQSYVRLPTDWLTHTPAAQGSSDVLQLVRHPAFFSPPPSKVKQWFVHPPCAHRVKWDRRNVVQWEATSHPSGLHIEQPFLLVVLRGGGEYQPASPPIHGYLGLWGPAGTWSTTHPPPWGEEVAQTLAGLNSFFFFLPFDTSISLIPF